MSVQKTLSGLGESLKPMIWSNRWLLTAATRALDGLYLARRTLGGGRKAAAVAVDQAAAPADLGRFQRYMTECNSIGGWFLEDSVAIWDALLNFQRERGTRGDLMEIGVLRGRSAALIALHAEEGESCVFVDPAFRKEAIDVIRNLKPERTVLLELLSQDIHDHPQITERHGAMRWIHIDGEHSGRAMTNDLQLALPLLAADGMIVLDDFFSTAYPQLTWAALRFLEQHPELTLVLAAANKGYICRKEAAPAYLAFLRDRLGQELRRRERSDFTIWKSTDPEDYGCFGITPRHKDLDYHGPDWAPKRIDI